MIVVTTHTSRSGRQVLYHLFFQSLGDVTRLVTSTLNLPTVSWRGDFEIGIEGRLECACDTSFMVEPTTQAVGRTAVDEAEPTPDSAGDDALIARVSMSRKAGETDSSGVDELLRRAADQNRAALDRLAH